MNDSVCTLINRAMAFRDTLSLASTRSYPKNTAASVVYKAKEENEGDENEEIEENEEDDECELGIEDPRYVAEKALLQELFFPEALKVPPDDDASTVESLSRIRLTFNVGNMVFCEPLIRLMESENKLDDVDSCFLTFTVPAIKGNNFESPEQCTYIRAVKLTAEKALFDHQFQLFWRISPDLVISNIWRECQMLEADIEFRGKGGETILECSGYLSLQDIVKDTSFMHQTHLVLIGSQKYSKNSGQNEGLNGSNIKEKESCTLLKCKKPMGMLEIGLKLVYDDTIRENLSIHAKEYWIYVRIHIGISVLKMANLNGETKSLMLIIKSGHHSAVRFISTKSESNSCSPTQALGYAILKAPEVTKRTTIYIEVWCNTSASTRLEKGGLENLCGLVKVPLSAVQGPRTHNDENIVDEDFPLLLSRNGSKKTKVRVIINLGVKSEMLNVLKQTRSAVIIQRNVRRFLEKMRSVRSRINKSKNEKLCADQGITQKHVFEVTVQRAKNVPIDVLLKNDIEDNSRYEGDSVDVLTSICSEDKLVAFIKYKFPGEDEPLYTHDIELEETTVFGATAHHRFTLAEDQCLINHLKNLHKDTSCLRFELWIYISVANNKKCMRSISYQQSIQISNNLNMDLRIGEGHKNMIDPMKRKKKCIGFAVLPIKELLSHLKLISGKSSSLKVTWLFNLPITFQKWVSSSASASVTYLVVQISYARFELAERCLLDETIFSDYAMSSSKSIFPLRATLDAVILDVVLQDKFTLSKLPVTTKWSIRFSLFPFNQELEHSYPPILKAWTKDLRSLRFRMYVTLDGLIIKEMQQNYMVFEVWKHVIHTQKQSPSSTPIQEDFWIGVSMVPCIMLISRKKGFRLMNPIAKIRSPTSWTYCM